MGYLHISNLYKEKQILAFKKCYAMEKIHGTSTHIGWKFEEKKIHFFSGGEKHENFIKLFDEQFLIEQFMKEFPDVDCTIFGEGYGGKQQGMSATYGKELKFIGFDVKVGHSWLDVPNAEDVCKKFNVEFVDYVEIETDIEKINAERDKDSVQAIRNGCGEGKKREGVILRPPFEVRTNNGERIIVKHKRDEFGETKTPREVSPEALKVLEDAKAIAEEWVTYERLNHVLGKLPQGIGMESISIVIKAMIEDVYREGVGEIVESQAATKQIGTKTATMFKQRLQNELNNPS